MTSFLLLILSLLLLLLLLPTTTPALSDDVLGLIVFKSDLRDPLSHLSSWNEDDDDPCLWPGVRCDASTRRVTDLLLSNLSLSGKLGRGLLQLSSLRSLTLSLNNFSGSLNPSLLHLPSLRSVDLSHNSLTGTFQDTFFSQCRSLRSLSLAHNSISGQIPSNIGSCSTLASLNLSSNRLSGGIPTGLWSLNALRALDLSNNLLVGEIPAGMGRMYNLRTISLSRNRLTGRLPDDIGAAALLKWVDFAENSLSGGFPASIRNLSLCAYLDLGSNSFDGEIPDWIGEMRSLKSLDLSRNRLCGEIKSSISELQVLQDVDLSWNSLTGSVPTWVFDLGLRRVSFAGNQLSGEMGIPASGSSSIRILDLAGNGFSGSVPVEISELYSLQFLNLSSNRFAGSIPVSIGKLKLVEVVDIGANRLNGTIPPEIGGVTSLKVLNFEKNSLTGAIPPQIADCSSLVSLDLSNNNLTGLIPPTLANLTSIQAMDFSLNRLTGDIPKQLGDLPELHYFNISHNFLSGDLPAGNFFNAIPPSSLSGNPSLCGSAVNRTCPTVLPKPLVLNPNSSSSQPSSGNNALASEDLRHRKIILSISALIAIGAAVVITVGVVTITVLNMRVRANASHLANAKDLSHDYLSQSPTTETHSGKLVMFSGADPEFSTGAHALLNKDCELGRGGFGAVYKTVLGDGRPVAIKKLTVSSLVKSQEEFEQEVKKLGKIRHHNLASLEGYYWTPSLQLLIYEFVPGGSLYKHIHESSALDCLSWVERFDIVLGTAKGLAHLHRLNIIHYNLKLTNVLIDGTGEPKVTDYGLAKLLPMLDRYVLSSKIQSALGYMAPEFACRTVRITEKCDVYGFGVLILEIMTGKRPVEYMEDDVVVLCDMVRGALEEGRVEECVDVRLCGKFPVEEAVPVMKLGLICTSQVPSNRPDMAEVVNILELIRCPQDSTEELSG